MIKNKLLMTVTVVGVALITVGCGNQNIVMDDIDKELEDLKEKYHLELVDESNETNVKDVDKVADKDEDKNEDKDETKEDNKEDSEIKSDENDNDILTELKNTDYDKEYKGKGYDFDKDENTLFISLGLTEDSINGIIVKEVIEDENKLTVVVESGGASKGELGIFHKINKDYDEVEVLNNGDNLKDLNEK